MPALADLLNLEEDEFGIEFSCEMDCFEDAEAAEAETLSIDDSVDVEDVEMATLDDEVVLDERPYPALA